MFKKTFQFVLVIVFILMSILIKNKLGQSPEPISIIKEPIKNYVETKIIETTNQNIESPIIGTLDVYKKSVITAEFSGIITDLNNNIVLNKKIKEGDLLFNIKNDTFQYSIEKAKVAKEIAEKDLILATANYEANRKIAQASRKDKIDISSNKPNFEKAELNAYQAKLNYNQLKEESLKNKITAPCDGYLLNSNIAMGQYINKNVNLGEFICTNTYTVKVSINNDLIELIDSENVRFINGDKEYVGRLLSVLPEKNTTFSQIVLFEIENNEEYLKPLVLNKEIKGSVQLAINYDYFKIENDLVKNGNEVWRYNGGLLEIKPIDIKFQDKNYTYFAIPDLNKIEIVTNAIENPFNDAKLIKMGE